MAQVKGTVEKISNRGKAWNINVSGNWYGFGFEAPQFSEGATVEFDVQMRGRYANVDKDTFKVVAEKAAASPNKGSTGGYSNSYDSRQQSINWQSARNAAIAFVDVASQLGAVTLPAAKAKKLDALAALVDNFTERYYYDTEAVATGDIESVVGANGAETAEPEGDELDDE